MTTSAFVWRLGMSTPPTLLKIVTMAACFLTPIYTSSEKRQLISDHVRGPLVAALGSPLMKALDRSVETLGLWIVTSSVTFIKSANQSSIKPCLIVHMVAVWTLIYFISMHVSKKNVPLRELCPKKMSQREGNARINTTDDLEQFGHKLWQF